MYGVSRGPDHTVGVQSSMKRVVDHTPSVYTRWQEHIISLPSSICGLGGGDKRRGAPRTSITESDTEIKRETIYVYVNAANDNDGTNESEYHSQIR